MEMSSYMVNSIMPIDLGNNPIGTPPTPEEKQQIRNSIDLGNVENIALSSWTGNSVLTLSASQVIGLQAASPNDSNTIIGLSIFL